MPICSFFGSAGKLAMSDIRQYAAAIRMKDLNWMISRDKLSDY